MQILRHLCRGLQSGVLVSLILGCAAASFAQDLGEIARQERARKQEHPSPAAHVYTNDDLQRQHILVPEDQARVVAARRAATNPTAQAAQTPLPAPPTVAALPAPVVGVAAVSAPAPAAAESASASTPSAAAAPAPIATPMAATVSDAVVMPASSQAAAQKIVTAEPGPTPLQAILQLVREASAEKHPATRRHFEPAVAVSHSAEWRSQRHRAIVARELVDPGIPGIVTVEPGDSLWALARRYLGSGRRWRELAALNTQILNVNTLHVGEWICLPPGNLQYARENIAPRARAPSAPRHLAQGACPRQDQGGHSDRFVVTAEPLGGPSHRGLSPSRCTSTP